VLNIILGITGSIAAYKSAEIANLLTKQGHKVHTIMTKAGAKFITPLTLQSLTKQRVYIDMFEEIIYEDIRHISLAQRADVFVIAPASANIIGKMANGIADDMLSTVVMATKAPVLLAPAMNTAMYENPIVQANIAKLKAHGYHFIEPKESRLACGDIGRGAMADVETIIEKIHDIVGAGIARPTPHNDVTIPPKTPTPQPFQIPQNDPHIQILLDMAEEVLGKPLKETEIQMYIEFYTQLGLTIEVIEFLLQYCIDKGKKANNYISFVAADWASRGFTTAAEAERFVSMFNNEFRNILRLFGVTNRDPVGKEIQYMERWLKEDGFTFQLIKAACEKTIISKANANFPYADGILNKWREKGITTIEEIEKLEKDFYDDKEVKKFKRPVEKIQTNKRKFQNFTGREWDHEKLAQLEKAYLDKKLGKTGEEQ